MPRPVASRKGANGSRNRITTVAGSGASIREIMASDMRFGEASAGSSTAAYVACTSAAVTGLPSAK